MRVLWFTNVNFQNLIDGSNSPNGGTWISLLLDCFKKSPEIEISIVAVDHQNFSGYKIININNVKVYIISEKIVQLRKSVSTYLNIIQNSKPDIIHVFGTEYSYGLITPHTNKPVLLHIQGNIYETFKIELKLVFRFLPFGLFGFDFLTYKLIVKKIIQLFKWKKYIKVENKIFKINKYVSGRTNFDFELCQNKNSYLKYFYCKEVIRIPDYNKLQIKPPQNKYVICTIANDNFYKGLFNLLKIAYILQNQNINIHWNVIGISESSLTYKIFNKFYKLNSINVSVLGKKNGDELLNELLNSDAYFHPSEIENSSNSICEAMTVGIPVIAYDIGGNSSLIDATSGILLQSRNYRENANEILSLLKNLTRKKTLPDLIHFNKYFRQNEDIIFNLKSIYQKIINENEKCKAKK